MPSARSETRTAKPRCCPSLPGPSRASVMVAKPGGSGSGGLDILGTVRARRAVLTSWTRSLPRAGSRADSFVPRFMSETANWWTSRGKQAAAARHRHALVRASRPARCCPNPRALRSPDLEGGTAADPAGRGIGNGRTADRNGSSPGRRPDPRFGRARAAAGLLERAIEYFESRSPGIGAAPRLLLARARSLPGRDRRGRGPAAEPGSARWSRSGRLCRRRPAAGLLLRRGEHRSSTTWWRFSSTRGDDRRAPFRSSSADIATARGRSAATGARGTDFRPSCRGAALEQDACGPSSDGMALLYCTWVSDRLADLERHPRRAPFFALPYRPARLRRLAGLPGGAGARGPPPRKPREPARPCTTSSYGRCCRHWRVRGAHVVPDGSLQALPFASLLGSPDGAVSGRGPRRWAWPRAERSSCARRPLQRQADRTGAALGRSATPGSIGAPRGLSDLPGAEAEAAEVAGLYERRYVLTGPGGTRPAFLEGLRSAQVVHFAGHAVSGANAEQDVCCWRRASRDTGALDLRSSRHGQRAPGASCRTGRLPHRRGNGLHGGGALSVARPFLAAGVPSRSSPACGTSTTRGPAFLRRSSTATFLLAGELRRPCGRRRWASCREVDRQLAHPSSWAGFVSLGGVSAREAPPIVRRPPRLRPVTRRPRCFSSREGRRTVPGGLKGVGHGYRCRSSSQDCVRWSTDGEGRSAQVLLATRGESGRSAAVVLPEHTPTLVVGLR